MRQIKQLQFTQDRLKVAALVKKTPGVLRTRGSSTCLQERRIRLNSEAAEFCPLLYTLVLLGPL